MKSFINRSSSTLSSQRSLWIDLLKGIAIIAVVLYHLDILEFGYLGVDLFLVVNGFLITGSIMKKYETNSFSYFDFIIKIAKFYNVSIDYIAGLTNEPKKLK